MNRPEPIEEREEAVVRQDASALSSSPPSRGEAGEGAARGHAGATKRRGDLVHFPRY